MPRPMSARPLPTSGVSGRTLGAGTAVVASCDTDGVTLSYASTYDTTSGTYRTASVTVNGLSNACDGKSLDITLRGASNVIISSGSIPLLSLPIGATVATLAFLPTVTAASITGAAIVITG